MRAAAGEVADYQVAAGGDPVPEASHHSPWVVFVGNEGENAEHQQRDRLSEVEQRVPERVVEDLVGVAEVALDGGDAVVAPDQRSGEGHRQRVDVDVEDPGVRHAALRDLMDGAGGGHTAAEVDELLDPGVQAVPHGAAQEGPVGLDHGGDVGYRGDEPRGERPVGGGVV